MKTPFSIVVLIAAFAFAPSAQAVSPTCAIQTYSGHYLTAVGGGGRTSDVIHSDATQVSTWEKFKIIASTHAESAGTYAIKTRVSANYLTAVGGGGRTSDVIHSDASQFKGWEQFRLVYLGGSFYAIQTPSGNYLTAVGGGGRTTDVIHSDATQIGAWEKFRFNCGY